MKHTWLSQQLDSAKQTIKQVHKYGNLLSLSKFSYKTVQQCAVICVVCLLAVNMLEVFKLMFQKFICEELS